MKTPQLDRWTGEFGRQYTDRSSLNPEELDALWRKNYGVGRQELNQRFLANISRDARILEVGCNLGNQLLALQRMGFHDLHGIEVQDYALDRARSRLAGVRLTQATAFEIPYPDNDFDLVFTSGVLIHIAPADLLRALREIHRCSRAYIWGAEYHSADVEEVNYRGEKSLLWKMDYPAFYLQHFEDLELLQMERLTYLENPNVDSMFMLRKKGTAATVARGGQ